MNHNKYYFLLSEKVDSIVASYKVIVMQPI